MALGWRHLHGAGVPARCDAALEYYAAAADAALAGARRERVLRPDDRARLAADFGAPRNAYGGADAVVRALAASRLGRAPGALAELWGAGGAGDAAAAASPAPPAPQSSARAPGARPRRDAARARTTASAPP